MVEGGHGAVAEEGGAKGGGAVGLMERPTLKRLSCRTFLTATFSPVSTRVAWKTTPKEPLPMTWRWTQPSQTWFQGFRGGRGRTQEDTCTCVGRGACASPALPCTGGVQRIAGPRQGVKFDPPTLHASPPQIFSWE